MRLKALLAIFTLLLAGACASDVTGPSTSRTPTVQRADGGTNTLGSGG
jgi:hypothetical protein